jgi:carbamoyl-phosphate synthase large subunit
MLFTCIGRRIQLLQSFRAAAERMGIDLTVHGADASILSPGIHRVDHPHLVPPIVAEDYIDTLLAIVERHGIDLLVPLLDFELPLLAAAADRFLRAGCVPVISTEAVVRVCRDKLATYEALRAAGIDTPATRPWAESSSGEPTEFPCYLKPRYGSAAMSHFVVQSPEELATLGRRVPDGLVQELVQGTEYTVDVYCGFDGRPRCAVPRKRLEIRLGEVTKALVVKDAAVMAVSRRVVETLEGCRGVVTVQCMVTPERRIRVLEINPRFGGGAPLAIHAGADFPRWILMERLGRKPRIHPSGFRGDVVMLRFSDAVYVPHAAKLARTGRLPRRAHHDRR